MNWKEFSKDIRQMHENHGNIVVLLLSDTIWLYAHNQWQQMNVVTKEQISSLEWCDNQVLIISTGTKGHQVSLWNLDSIQQWSMVVTQGVPYFFWDHHQMFMVRFFLGGWHLDRVDHHTGIPTFLQTFHVEYMYLFGNRFITNKPDETEIFSIVDNNMVKCFHAPAPLRLLWIDDFIFIVIHDGRLLQKYQLQPQKQVWSVPFHTYFNSIMAISRHLYCLVHHRYDQLYLTADIICAVTGTLLQKLIFHAHWPTIIHHHHFSHDGSKLFVPIRSTIMVQDLFPSQRRSLQALVFGWPHFPIFTMVSLHLFV